MMKNDVYDNLSYVMKIKTDKIITLKQEVKNYKFYFILSQIVMYIIACIMLFDFDTYVSVFTSMFVKNYNVYTNTLLLHQFLLVVFLISCSCVIYSNRRHKKSDDKYKTLRHNIIDIIQNEYHPDFCSHDEICGCREHYIKFMKEVYDIDVVIK